MKLMLIKIYLMMKAWMKRKAKIKKEKEMGKVMIKKKKMIMLFVDVLYFKNKGHLIYFINVV